MTLIMWAAVIASVAALSVRSDVEARRVGMINNTTLLLWSVAMIVVIAAVVVQVAGAGDLPSFLVTVFATSSIALALPDTKERGR